MKKRNNLFIFLAVSLLAIASCSSQKSVQSNGKVETREFKVSDYSKIELQGGAKLEFEYEQKKSAPRLSVTTDREIFEKMEIRVSGGKLVIRPKERNARLSPTVFKVVGNSRHLDKVELTGGGVFSANSPLSTRELELEITGSGHIRLNEKVEADEVSAEIAGSGKFAAYKIQAREISCEIAGSGNMMLGGTARKGSFEIAGSGKIDASGCTLRSADAEIAGSGNIRVKATEALDAEIAGSGLIEYRGNPSNISRSVSGSGTIRNAN